MEIDLIPTIKYIPAKTEYKDYFLSLNKMEGGIEQLYIKLLQENNKIREELRLLKEKYDKIKNIVLSK
jgi:hypothetical protein